MDKKPVEMFVIDTNADPSLEGLPEGTIVKVHKVLGRLTWGEFKIRLFRTEEQKLSAVYTGEAGSEVLWHLEQEEELGMKLLNANVLDFLLEHPQLIPKSWKDKNVYFWGTMFYPHPEESSDTIIRYLLWEDGKWSSSYCYMYFSWYDDEPAAVIYIVA